jgi:molecular chaperone GrpE
MAPENDAFGGRPTGGGFGEAPGGPAGAQTPEERIAALEADLAAAREELSRANDRWVRERADLENLKRRSARERTDLARYGSESLLRDLVAVTDNLERAVHAARNGGDVSSLTEGVELVLKGFHDVLERHGVSLVDATGARFDPAVHEAVAHIESSAHGPNMIVDQHQRGYRLHDRLLRPARVTVAKGNPASNPAVQGVVQDVVNDEGGD